MKIDTLEWTELDQMLDNELVCQWCDAPAEYMWRHHNTVHFLCGDCAEEEQDLHGDMILEGQFTAFCLTCKVEVDITKIRFVKI